MASSTTGPGNNASEPLKDVQDRAASNKTDCIDERVPQLGMKFTSEEEAYSFYNKYAELIGFSVRRGSNHKVKNTSIIQQRTFLCSRQGARVEDKREDSFSYSRPETRCECDAHMKISLRNGFYYVYEFQAEHNHILAPGSMAQYLRSQRKVTEAQIANAEVAKSVGISNKATIDLMAKEACGPGNLGFIREDMKNRLYSKRTLKAKQGDTGGVLEYMEKKAKEDVKFFYSIQVEKREQWALVYGRNTFSAHMSTTQRSESMNNELKHYISVKYDMLTFFEHFERLVEDKRLEEVRSDFKATQTSPKLKAEASYILKQAATTYTPAIFKMFQEQLLRTLNYDTILCDDSDQEQKVYKVYFHGTQREHVVTFVPKEEKVNCSCKKFEFAGILCSHSLKILDINNIKHIPKLYILKRWTIDAKVLEITSNRNLHEDRKARMTNCYKELSRMFVKISARAAESEESYQIASHCGELLAQEVEKCLKIRSDPDQDLGNSSTSEGQNINSNRISKHNEGLAKPKGIKVKEKTVRGSARPVGGLDKGKRKKSTADSVQLQPQMPFTNQIPIYLPQYNPILMGELGAMSNGFYSYFGPYNSGLQPSIGTSTPTVMPGQNLPFFQQHNTE